MVECPACGHKFNGRAKLGEGTRRGEEISVNENRAVILAIFRQAKKPLSVKDVQKIIIEKKVKRFSKRGTGWNYHTIQADISLLLGDKKLKMLEPREKEIWDEKEGFTTKGIPLYALR
jgi:hypothetical protein